MRTILAVLALVAFGLAASSAHAIGRRPQRPQPPQRPNRYYQNAANAQAIYPRYYGQIHARQIDNIGVPPGDIGLRGNSITLQPW